LRILALDANKPRRGYSFWRVHVPLVVNVRHAGLQRVNSGAPDFAWLIFSGRFKNFPVAHFRLADGLPIDRPGVAVIVRIGFSGAMAHVCADAETQVGIFVNHLTIRRVLVEIGGQEPFILEHLLHQLPNFTPP
jgi:hypothetical protein